MKQEKKERQKKIGGALFVLQANGAETIPLCEKQVVGAFF
jgi:hypothetical protein